MTHRIRSLLIATVLGAGTSACATSTGLEDIRFRVLDAVQSSPAGSPTLFVRGQLTNNSTVPLVSGGCLRPNISVDSLSAGNWVPMNSQQSEELVVCIRAFTVDPGGTAEFDAYFGRPNRVSFPIGVPLRLRVVAQNESQQPSATLQLPR